MHAVLNIPWNARSNMDVGKGEEIQIEGDDLADTLDKLQTQIEKLYEKPLRKLVGELLVAVIEEGQPVKAEKLKDRFKIKVYLTVGLGEKPIRRKAKK